ncbi:MAG: carbon storage regulator [Planctomycetaceae bacterium]|nr:carbon storage regulator [Planctomycetaceae bacterium]
MLVLSRRPTESIRIGSNVVVNVIAVRGERVRLGIQAPKSIVVLRGELRDNLPSTAGCSRTEPRDAEH